MFFVSFPLKFALLIRFEFLSNYNVYLIWSSVQLRVFFSSLTSREIAIISVPVEFEVNYSVCI